MFWLVPNVFEYNKLQSFLPLVQLAFNKQDIVSNWGEVLGKCSTSTSTILPDSFSRVSVIGTQRAHGPLRPRVCAQHLHSAVLALTRLPVDGRLETESGALINLSHGIKGNWVIVVEQTAQVVHLTRSMLGNMSKSRLVLVRSARGLKPVMSAEVTGAARWPFYSFVGLTFFVFPITKIPQRLLCSTTSACTRVTPAQNES